MSPTLGAPFRGFRDDEKSPFFRAPGHTPEETWEISVDRMARLLVGLDALMTTDPIEMSPGLLCSWHCEIFGELFPEHAGRLRGVRDGRPEHVYFGVHDRGYRGTAPRALRRRLEKTCGEFNAAAAEIRVSGRVGADTFDAVHAATRLYAKTLRAHPFVDGNLRTSFAALNAGLLTLGLDTVAFEDLESHDKLLGIAFAGKHEPYRPLAEQIAQIISEPRSA